MEDNDVKTVPTASHDMLQPSLSGQLNQLTNGAFAKQQIKKSTRARSKSESNSAQQPIQTELFVKSAKEKGHERKSRNRKGTGKPKKDGAGGKGTWGKAGDIYEEVREEDPRDPNYEEISQQEDSVMAEVVPDLTSHEFDKVVTPIIREYYNHGITSEVAASLSELNITHLKHRIVHLTVSLAMEQKASKREMTSVLISDLYGERIMIEQDVELGFQALLNSLKELVLDTPDAPEVLGLFMARCIADDCLNPSFIGDHMQHPTEIQKKALNKANQYLKMKHGIVRLDNCWGHSGGSRPVKTLVKEIVLLIKEYLSSRDLAEAERCVMDLDVPHFHHEIVYEAVQIALEDGSPRCIEGITGFLRHLFDAGMLTVDQINAGFERIYNNMDDIVLDCPRAYKHLDLVVDSCCRANVVSIGLRQKAPTRARKRYVSEGDWGISTQPIN